MLLHRSFSKSKTPWIYFTKVIVHIEDPAHWLYATTSCLATCAVVDVSFLTKCRTFHSRLILLFPINSYNNHYLHTGLPITNRSSDGKTATHRAYLLLCPSVQRRKYLGAPSYWTGHQHEWSPPNPWSNTYRKAVRTVICTSAKQSQTPLKYTRSYWTSTNSKDVATISKQLYKSNEWGAQGYQFPEPMMATLCDFIPAPSAILDLLPVKSRVCQSLTWRAPSVNS